MVTKMVTKVEPLTKTNEKGELEGGFAAGLYKGEVSRFGIREGVEIPAETVEKSRTEVS